MKMLPVLPAHQLGSQPEAQRWLIEHLWGEQAVGIIGGEPKCCKSFLALELAVAVASGRPCLRRFSVAHPGRVLLFAAEDALHVVRQRLAGIAEVAGVSLEQLDVQVITASRVRLDLDADVQRLANTIEALKPRLLVLDPFVRLHRCDENASAEVAPLLDLLRQLQRQHNLAVIVVHHAKKGGNAIRAGQALRGSSEFHAWGDSLLYLRRHGEKLSLLAEHRAAASPGSLTLQLRSDGGRLALEIIDKQPLVEPPAEIPLAERVRTVLAAAAVPLGLASLRNSCHTRKATLCLALAELTRAGHVVKTDDGYRLSSS